MPKFIKINTLTLLLAFLVSVTSFAQIKYPSLLWEISGNGLEKPSYLYGTMHVSSKLAFHLTDDFFESIEGVDVVALESDPTMWLSETEETEDSPMLINSRFYRQFPDKALDKYSLALQLASDHSLINGLLYRSNSAMQDFQEDTYLDMFIFQAGSRFGKQIVGLEDFKESRDLVEVAYKEEVVKSEKPTWLKDMLKEKSYEMILKDSYRSNNLDMIDSLNIGYSTEHYLEYMLFKRNDNMVEVYDSIISNGKTIFAGVGAAHLPGDRGMIEGFRAKGYTVKPVMGKWTNRGKIAKKRIEDKRITRTYSTYLSSDGFLEFPTPTKVHEISLYGKTMYLAPDITNGSYIAVSRVKLNAFAKKENQDLLDFENIDKILIEYIPGKILSQNNITKNGFQGLDIRTKTKTGDHHRYAIFKTPLEFIIIKMVGKGKHILNESHFVFDKIKFHYSENLKTISPLQGGFSVQVPDLYFLDNNNDYTTKIGNPNIQAYNSKAESYYFIKQKVLNDAVFLEKDSFELFRIQEMYFAELEIDDYTSEFSKDGHLSVLVSTGQLNTGETIQLKSIIKGVHYYLLGTINETSQKTNDFFNSFTLTKMNFNTDFVEIIDTNLLYSVKASKKAVDNIQNSKAKKKSNESEVKRQTFNSISKQQIFLKYHKYNNFDQYSHVDSIWNDIVQYKVRKSQIIEDSLTGLLSNGDSYLDLVMSDTATERRLKFRYIIHGGVQYKISTVLDSKSISSNAFVNSVFNTFLPLDTIVGLSPMLPKADLFFDALYSKVDSINQQAYKHYYNVQFTDKDKLKLIKTIEEFKFKDENINLKKHLISGFTTLNTSDKFEYLIKWYKLFDDNADIQLDILKRLSSEADKKSYKTIGRLIENDIPLPYNEYKISNLFFTLDKNPELEGEILKEIIGLLSISEYQESILETLSHLYNEDVLEKRILKKIKNQLIALAKVELKRSRSAQIANTTKEYSNKKFKSLNYLVQLLFPFRKDEKVIDFYKKINSSSFNDEKIKLLTLKVKEKGSYTNAEIESFAQDIKTRESLYKQFKKEGLLDHFPESYNNVDSISKSFVTKKFKNKDEDILTFYKKTVVKRKNISYTLLLYKLSTKNYKQIKQTKLVYTIYNKSDLSKPVESKNNGEYKSDDEKDTLKLITDKFILKNHPRVSYEEGQGFGW